LWPRLLRHHRIARCSLSCRAGCVERGASSVLWLIAVSMLSLEPNPELSVFSKQQFQSLTHDIRFRRINELSVPVELRFDLLLDTNL
jgi:hypothetical protein